MLTEAIEQIPAWHRRRLLVTIDGAGASHAVVTHLTELNAVPGQQVHYSVGFDLDGRARTAIGKLPAHGWEPALDADGHPRTDAEVAELTGLLRRGPDGDKLAGWPPDMRIIVRREPISPGAQISLFEQHAGKRYQLTATNTPRGQVCRLEARHRGHARVEDNIRTGKNTGLNLMPSRDYAINIAWCQAIAIGCDLLAWTRLLALDGPLATAEPATLRYRLLHVAARLTHGQRHRRLKIPPSWPWAEQLHQAFDRVLAIPAPT